MSLFSELLHIPGVLPAFIGAMTWLGHRILGARANTRAGQVASALGEAGARMLQLGLEAPATQTKDQTIIQFKGVVAVCLAKVGITERDRAPYQADIDHVIARAVTAWMERRR